MNQPGAVDSALASLRNSSLVMIAVLLAAISLTPGPGAAQYHPVGVLVLRPKTERPAAMSAGVDPHRDGRVAGGIVEAFVAR